MPTVEVMSCYVMKNGKPFSGEVISKTGKLMFQINDNAWGEVNQFVRAFIMSPEVKNTYTTYMREHPPVNGHVSVTELGTQLKTLISKKLEGNCSGFVKEFFGNLKIKGEVAFEVTRMFLVADLHPNTKFAKTAYMTRELTGHLFLSKDLKVIADSILTKFHKKATIMKIQETLDAAGAKLRGRGILLERAAPEVAAEEASAAAAKAERKALKPTAGSVIKGAKAAKKEALAKVKAARGVIGEVLEEATKLGKKVVKAGVKAIKRKTKIIP